MFPSLLHPTPHCVEEAHGPGTPDVLQAIPWVHIQHTDIYYYKTLTFIPLLFIAPQNESVSGSTA